MTSPLKTLTALVSPATYLFNQSQKATPAPDAPPAPPPPAPDPITPTAKTKPKGIQQSFLSGVAASGLSNSGGGSSGGKTLLGS